VPSAFVQACGKPDGGSVVEHGEMHQCDQVIAQVIEVDHIQRAVVGAGEKVAAVADVADAAPRLDRPDEGRQDRACGDQVDPAPFGSSCSAGPST
jgi:hypothetical protein